MAKDIAIIGSLDSSWLASRDIDYGISILKASLIFFDEIEITDSELIDSNQMRYAFDNGLKSLMDYKKIKIAMRQNSFHDLLQWQLDKDMPMLFGSLDYISNNTISKLKTSGNLSLEFLYKIFDNDDIRSGRCESLITYKNYISGLDEHTENRIKFNVDDKLFFQILSHL